MDDMAHDAVEMARLAFREGMAKLAAAVSIVTTDGPGGLAGFTASAVCSVTDTPPTLIVCLNRSSSVAAIFDRNRSLCVNTLASGREELSRLFGGSTPQQERFAAGEWLSGKTGAPRLKDAIVSFDCDLESSIESGTHRVLFCRVIDIAHGKEQDEALVYFKRRYHRIR